MIVCKGQNVPNSDILLLETSKGKIIYEGISNEIFYNTWSRNTTVNLKFKGKENCNITEHGGFISVTPTDNAKYVIVNVSLNDSISQDFLFFVQKLPLPQLLYNLDTAIEKQNLPTEIEKTDLKNLKSLEAMVEIGRLSWVSYEIKNFEIVILHSDEKPTMLKNVGPNMSEENFNYLMTLKKGDIICFMNIDCINNGKPLIFNERTIKIK
jgi:hypothetical protein